MPDQRFFRIRKDDIDELRDMEFHQEMIDGYARWVEIFSPRIDGIIDQITTAFAGVELGDGVGLYEADGIDGYASDDERRELRSRDEQRDWRRISPEVLGRCEASPTFFDPKGFVFHLPAFLIAELNDQYSHGFIYRLIYMDKSPDSWPKLLTPLRREAIISALLLVGEHPRYEMKRAMIDAAVEYYRAIEPGKLESRL